MEGWGAVFLVLLVSVMSTVTTVAIFAAIHILVQGRASPLERRMWGIR